MSDQDPAAALPAGGSIEIHYDDESWIQVEQDTTGVSDFAIRMFAPRSAEQVGVGQITVGGLELLTRHAETVLTAEGETSMADLKAVLEQDDPVPSDSDPRTPAEQLQHDDPDDERPFSELSDEEKHERRVAAAKKGAATRAAKAKK
jgi:hypothetical protein